MKYSNVICSVIFVLHAAEASLKEPVIENVVHLQTAVPPNTPGIWKNKMIWKARWVKEWKLSKHWRPVWKKVWSPIQIKEWIPIPKPPPPEVLATLTPKPPIEETVHLPGSPIGPPIEGAPPAYPSNPPVYGPPPSGPPSLYDGQVVGPSGPSTDLHSGFSHEPPSTTYGEPDFKPPSGRPELLSSFPSGPSTPLHIVRDEHPSWPTHDAQDLLTSYKTIKDPNRNNPPLPERPPPFKPLPTSYEPIPRNPERLAEFLMPPTSPSIGVQSSRVTNEIQYTESRNQTASKSVSPYAAKLAQAVLRDKFNKSLNPTERPSGLTDIVYKSPLPTSTPASIRVPKSSGGSTTEGSNVYIVTPVALG